MLRSSFIDFYSSFRKSLCSAVLCTMFRSTLAVVKLSVCLWLGPSLEGGGNTEGEFRLNVLAEGVLFKVSFITACFATNG